MGRKIVAEGESFKIEFETEGSGSYHASCLGLDKGPFNSQEAARRWIMSRQERYLETGNADNEEDLATKKALFEAEMRTAEQEAAAQRGDPNWRDVGRTNAQDEEDDAEEAAVREIQRQRQEAEAQEKRDRERELARQAEEQRQAAEEEEMKNLDQSQPQAQQPQPQQEDQQAQEQQQQ